MVFRVTLTIRHIRGDVFQVEVDHDADCIGLKVAIWEAQNIPVETQRLVYAGKELDDSTKLASVGIEDGATIFLVESREQVDAVEVSSQQPVFREASPEHPPEVNMNVNVVHSINVQNYQPLDNETMSNDRIDAVVDLAFWVRLYCLFGILVSVVNALMLCFGSLLPLLLFILGYFGTKKLNRCLLICPMIIAALAGFVGTTAVVIHMVYQFFWPLVVALVVCLLHIMIFASICKLMCRLNRLSCAERKQAVARVKQRRCCFCC